MKKALSIVLSLMLLLAVVPVGTISAEALEDNVIEIRTIAELYNINNNMSGNYKLMNDIDMTNDVAVGGDWDFMGNGWEPIGSNGDYDGVAFTGTFDGGGHKIIGMRIEVDTVPKGINTDRIHLGLFSTNKGVIKNLGFENNVIKNGTCSGSICSDNFGEIVNCYNTGDISCSKHGYSGGICGVSYGYYGGYITDCYNTGKITSIGDVAFAGGICGYALENNNMVRCYNSGEVFSQCSSQNSYYEAYAGGICAFAHDSSNIDHCFNTGKISAISSGTNSLCGGICGKLAKYGEHYTHISNCYNTGDIGLSSTYSGGICGYSDDSLNTIVNCYSTGSARYGIDGGNLSQISNCYYYTGIQNTNAIALTEDEFKSESSFTGFDFEKTWVILQQSAYEYPQLKNILNNTNHSQETEPTEQTLESGFIDPTQGTNPTEDTSENKLAEPTDLTEYTQSSDNPTIPITGTSEVATSEAVESEVGTSETIVASGTAGKCTWTLDNNGVLIISGNGSMENYYYDSKTPWYSERESITTVLIENGVTSIGSYAFYNCTSLTSVTIGNNVMSIGDCAFDDCTSLTSVTIPSSVTIIGYCAFCRCSGLAGISISDRVTSIGEGAFLGCSGLTSITIPNSVTNIETGAFLGCSGLTSVTIPNSVTNIGTGAFLDCSGLTSITIPNSVTNIGARAFRNCTGLTSITIPNSVTSIGAGAFNACKSLTSVTIGNSVSSIGAAFCDCTGITNIMVAPQNTVFDSRNNCNAIIETETNQLIVGCSTTIIPNSVTSIGYYAFSGCSSLTSITIPNSVTCIGKSAFNRCSSLKRIIIPDSVTSIGEGAFSACGSITSITIPDSVTSIGDGAFYGCTKLYGAFVPIDFIGLNINNIFPSTTEIYYREKEFTVNYDANGGVDAPEQLLFTSDSKTIPFTVTNQNPSRTGYIFEGWSKEPNGSADYLPGKTYTISNSITLYAVWKERKPYTIKYELCGGEGDIPSQIKTEGIDLKLSSIIPTHAKYSFAFWISSDGKTKYDKGSTYKIDADDTLYAVWKETCSVCNGTRYSEITKCRKCGGDGKITYTTDWCDSCNGTGKVTKTRIETCSQCKGSGEYYGYGFDANGNFGWGIIPCPLCNATGKIKTKEQVNCTKCGGDGKAVSEINCSNCDGFGNIRTICDKCNGKNSIIYHYPNFETEQIVTEPLETNVTEPTTSESVTEPYFIEPTSKEQPTVEPITELTTYEPTDVQPTAEPEIEPFTVEPTEEPPTIASTTEPTANEPTIVPPVIDLICIDEPAPTRHITDKPENTVIKKKDNPIKVTVKTKKVKFKKLKKKAQKVKAIKVKNNIGKVTYKLVKKGITKKIRKLVKIYSKGVITIKKWKKAKKGTYKIKVTVKAAGNKSYNAKAITKTVKVKIR